MFNVTGTEIILLLLVALIVLGPEKLPDAVRRFGRTYGELKRMSQGFQAELRDALEEPSRELRSTVQAAKDIVQAPVQGVRSTAQGMKDLAQGKPAGSPTASSPRASGGATTPSAVARPAANTPPDRPADPDTSPDTGPDMDATADLEAVPDELWDGEPGG